MLMPFDYAFLSTAPGRRQEVVSTRMKAAAHAGSDVDTAYLSTAAAAVRLLQISAD